MDYQLFDVAKFQKEKESLIHENEGLKILVTQLLKLFSKITDTDSLSNSLTQIIKDDSIKIQELSKMLSIYESNNSVPLYSTQETQTNNNNVKKKSKGIQIDIGKSDLISKINDLELENNNLKKIIAEQAQKEIQLKSNMMVGMANLFDSFKYGISKFIKDANSTIKKYTYNYNQIEKKVKELENHITLKNQKLKSYSLNNIPKSNRFQLLSNDTNHNDLSPNSILLLETLKSKIKECQNNMHQDYEDIIKIIQTNQQ